MAKINGKIPVILDTDIGTDIDDIWALAFLLKCPELEVRLITTATGDTECRARLVAKFLEAAGRCDIPIGIGPAVGQIQVYQQQWVRNYRLSAYPGSVHADGVQVIVDTVMHSSEEITIVAIAPLPNIAEALEREPAIAGRTRFVGMQGSIRKGHNGREKPCAEYNVASFAKEAQRVFAADWDMTITPLDTCASVRLKGEKLSKITGSTDPLLAALTESHFLWCKNQRIPSKAVDFEKETTPLYDTVAVYLAFARELLEMERLAICVTDDGYTRIDPTGKVISAAMNWKSLSDFEDLLVERLTS